jgi:peptidoglycan hydrolase-like protein with peptidoglycan-binding domain
MRIVTLLFLSILVVTASGCVSKGRHDREVASLQGQISQMDMALRAQEAQGTPSAQAPALKGSFTGATYRTPTGFELPASEIQKALKNAGYYAGSVDGKIGPGSREAIRSFQRDNGLTADGVCGKQTWAKLKTHLNVAG